MDIRRLPLVLPGLCPLGCSKDARHHTNKATRDPNKATGDPCTKEFVMPGLDPGIHVFAELKQDKDVDGRA
jgi:hypothetical protein